MLTFLEVIAFGGGASVSIYALCSTVVPQADRIMAALRGDARSPFTPLATLARAERRIAVRRWAATSARPVRVRAAA